MMNGQAVYPPVIIGLGANLTEPVTMMRESLRRLGQNPGLKLTALSSVYLTEPQGGPRDQNWYHNAVALFECALAPLDLLKLLLAVELELGRERLEYCGPRVIDLDVLAWGSLVIEDPPDLVLPHPRMHQRLFVMAPLAELAPEWRHPLLGLTASEILAGIDPAGQGIRRLDSGRDWLEGEDV